MPEKIINHSGLHNKSLYKLLVVCFFLSGWLSAAEANCCSGPKTMGFAAAALVGSYLFRDQPTLSPVEKGSNGCMGCSGFSASLISAPEAAPSGGVVMEVPSQREPRPILFVNQEKSASLRIIGAYSREAFQNDHWLIFGVARHWYLYDDILSDVLDESTQELKATVNDQDCPELSDCLNEKVLPLRTTVMDVVSSDDPDLVSFSRNEDGVLMATYHMPGHSPLTVTANEYQWMKALFFESVYDAFIFGTTDCINGSLRSSYPIIVVRRPDKTEMGRDEINEADNDPGPASVRPKKEPAGVMLIKQQFQSQTEPGNDAFKNVSQGSSGGAASSDSSNIHGEMSVRSQLEAVIKKDDRAAVEAMLNHNPDIVADTCFLSDQAVSALFSHRFQALEALIRHGVSLPYLYADIEAVMLKALDSGNYAAFNILFSTLAFDEERQASIQKTMVERAFGLRSAKWLKHILSLRLGDSARNSALDLSCKQGEPMLALAVQSCSMEVARVLLANGADPDTAFRGVHVLREAVERSASAIVRLLCSYGSDVDGVSLGAGTPLSQAAKKGDLNMVELLLDFGADINAGNGEVSTPLQLAAKQGYFTVVRRLRERGAKASPADLMEWFGYDPADDLLSLEERCFIVIKEQLMVGNWDADRLPLPPKFIRKLKKCELSGE